MSNSNTIDRTTDAPVLNWNTYESEEYKLVLVGVKDVEKNLLRRLHYRNVPEFKALPDKSTRYCVLLLENKFIPGKYEGEATYFETDPFAFRTVHLEKSQVDFFREHNICTGTLDCKFDEYGIDEKFVLPSKITNGVFEYQEVKKETTDKYLNAIASEAARNNKYERLERIVQMHAFVESIFYGRDLKYLPSEEIFSLTKRESKKVLSMNKILGTDPFERDLEYWKNILPKYFFSSSEGLKDVHLKDYQNAIACNAAAAFTLFVSSLFEFYYNKFDLGTASFISGSLMYMDVMFRSALTAIHMKATNTFDSKPGFIGSAGDFTKFWKNIFKNDKNKNS